MLRRFKAILTAITPTPPLNFFDPYYGVFHWPFFFAIGACMGSFFNVCIYRIPRGMALSYPGSHCYSCGRPVRWFDNIPLLSYWILRGRCRQCGATFSIRYFIVELLTALLFTLTYFRLGPSLALFPAFVFLSLLIVATFTDLDHWIIPDRVSLGGLVVGLALAAAWSFVDARPETRGAREFAGPLENLSAGNPLSGAGLVSFLIPTLPARYLPLANSLAGMTAGFLVLWFIGLLGALIFRKEAMGFGDVKLFAMFGAFCGLDALPYILILACFFGTIAGLAGILIGRLAARRSADPAIAPLATSPDLNARLIGDHPLGNQERQAVSSALTRPGTVGYAGHHLPFGPSLALAAAAVYLYGPVISRSFIAMMDWLTSKIFGPPIL